MKRFKPTYTHALIILSLVLSIALQGTWLNQLFLAQRKQLLGEVEQLVSTAAQTNIYNSMASFKNRGNLQQVRQFFLSAEWLQLKQAFDNMKMEGLNTSSLIRVNDDSTSVSMSFVLKDSAGIHENKAPLTTETGLTAEELHTGDSVSIVQMKAAVAGGLKTIGINSGIYHNLYTYTDTVLTTTDKPVDKLPAFNSKKYKYNVPGNYKYQLQLADVNGVILYRIRYYVASSILMLVLTCAAFYFILRLLRRQQLYAAAKDHFTGNMTHEFKTPIATIAVALESINKYNLINDPEKLQQYLDISQQQLQRLDEMVEKVLNINSEKENPQALHKELFDVQTGLQQVIASMQPLLVKNHAAIHFLPAKEPCFVLGDPVHLTNIFHNLVDNAVKYTGNGLLMNIQCKGDINKVTISFKDNGPGIAADYQQKIFERYFRVPVTGNILDVKGSGLGLYYVKQIIEKHGGTIVVKSAPGAGTDFIITLPAAS